MIKEKLMEALKVAAADYNGGMGADAAVAKAAEAADFNEHQTDRLVEMFNTLAAINQEKDASDPTGACELASKGAVAKILLDGSMRKAASAPSTGDPFRYSFYSGDPLRTNRSIEARESGMASMTKAASAECQVKPELDVSQRSLYKVICEKIDLLKSASDAADEAARVIKLEMERSAVKVAKAIESPFAPAEVADMFKAACKSEKAVGLIGEYSTKVAESTGGKYSGMEVFDASPVEDLLKTAAEIETYIGQIPEYEKKRDLYMSKASEAEETMKEILGLAKKAQKESIADFFNPASVVKKAGEDGSEPSDGSGNGKPSLSVKIAELIRKSGIKSEEVEKLAQELEKDAVAAPRIMTMLPLNSGDALSAFKGKDSVSDEALRLQNVERGLLLSDAIANDPILRDADPRMISQIYKSIVKSAPRISLDPALVVSVLRTAANSVALSPADAKVLTDVDKGIALSNIERLTNLDSSIKDSNRA